ncbi:MAG: hypothetical protein JW778_02690 [Candidatus Altiarchaeota archaeon]|nr:hypothetical protein [Candidatus Altiarchaeota archaeon]
MNTKRVLIATFIGLLCGLFCAAGTMSLDNPNLIVTTGLLVSIVYNRTLIGFIVGISEHIQMHPVLRGGIIGFFVTLAIAITSIVDNPTEAAGSPLLMLFGIVYGILADVIASKFGG